jgi:hypothetical protein
MFFSFRLPIPYRQRHSSDSILTLRFKISPGQNNFTGQHEARIFTVITPGRLHLARNNASATVQSRGLRSSGMLRSAARKLATDVPGQSIVSVFRRPEVPKELNTGPIGCLEKLVTNYQPKMSKILQK